MIERQELHCHNCNRYVQFDVDLELTGNHVLSCPNCGHEHCRVVRDGIITDERWDSRNGPMSYTVSAASITSSTASIDTTSTGSTAFTTDMWLQSTTASSTGYF